MEKNPNFVIVIGRQFGSGGRTIGKIIADRLGIAYYDTELISKAAEEEGVDPALFKELDEKKPNVLKALLQGVYGIPDNFHTVPISGEQIYKVQSKLIKDLCKKNSCVIVGRNADYVLRKHPRLVSVFLHSPIEARAQKIVERGDADTKKEALALASRNDRRRESYYNFYTGKKKWGVASNYHISLDTSALDSATVADIIISLVEKKLNIKASMQK